MPLRSYFTTSNADWWARLNPAAPKEKLLVYWDNMVSAAYDPGTGIAMVTVRAFSTGAAHAIAVALADSAEKLVNRMEERTRQDQVRFAQELVDRDQKRLHDIENNLLKLRMENGVIDPTTSVVTDNVTLAHQLKMTLAQLLTQYEAIFDLSPRSPSLAPLRGQIKATRDQLAATEAKISSTPKGAVLPSMVGAFAAATLDLQFVQQALTNDLVTLQTALLSAVTQSLYIMEQVPPNLPESSIYPRRLLTVGLIALVCFGIWVVAACLIHAVKAHLT